MSDEITYPNHEHRKEDRAARRRALDRLSAIEAEAARLRRMIERGQGEGEDGATMARLAGELTLNLTVLGVLREVREWDAADPAGRWEPAPGCAVAHPYGEEGWRPGGGDLREYDVHEHWVPGREATERS
jgi:hypothetical protein